MPTDALKIKKMLPIPARSGGAPLMDALRLRRSIRLFSDKEIPLDLLSNLLWAANGVNRPDSKGRTTAAAYGIHNIQIYLAMSGGLFLYHAFGHFLEQVDSTDLRMQTGIEGPIQLFYAAVKFQLPEHAEDLAAIHAGSMAENVYLFCASEGLATAVKGSVAPDLLHQLFQLSPDQEIVLGQAVGYPARPSPVRQALRNFKYLMRHTENRIFNYFNSTTFKAGNVHLPDPKRSGGMSLNTCLSKRKSHKRFTREEISPEQLSGLLWAAYGYNRPMIGKRTAPSAFNCQNISLYAVTSGHLYFYDALRNQLVAQGSQDVVAQAARQTWMDDVAVTLIYAADLSLPIERIRLYSFAQAGAMSQNAALFCAGNGLGNVIFTSFDHERMRQALSLDAGQEVVLMQSTGIPE